MTAAPVIPLLYKNLTGDCGRHASAFHGMSLPMQCGAWSVRYKIATDLQLHGKHLIPTSLHAFIRTEIAKWSKVIKKANIKIE